MSVLHDTIDRPEVRPKPVLKITKQERTRASILDAAVRFLWTRPFRDLSVGELMSNTQVTRSAFYQYFDDLHDLMKTLLHDLEHEILTVANPWLAGGEDRLDSLRHSLAGLVRVCRAYGPILRAVHDAAITDQMLETAWNEFLGRFDTAVAQQIEKDQAAGLTGPIDAQAVAVALNRMDAFTFIHAFGWHPRQPEAGVRDGITHIWLSTLYARALAGAGETN